MQQSKGGKANAKNCTPPRNWKKPVKHLCDGVNRGRLRGIIAARGLTQTQIAAAYQKDNALISNKLTGRAPFNASDINFFKEYLKLSTEDATAIFFSGLSKEVI